MMVIKTLKDIKTVKDLLWDVKAPLESGMMETLNHFVRIQELRAEAVKWIKHFNTLQGEGDYSDMEISAITHNFMRFFNLTEEDLNGS